MKFHSDDWSQFKYISINRKKLIGQVTNISVYSKNVLNKCSSSFSVIELMSCNKRTDEFIWHLGEHYRTIRLGPGPSSIICELPVTFCDGMCTTWTHSLLLCENVIQLKFHSHIWKRRVIASDCPPAYSSQKDKQNKCSLFGWHKAEKKPQNFCH